MLQKAFQSSENKAVAIFVLIFALFHFGALFFFGIIG